MINKNVYMHKHWMSLVGLTGLYEGADEASYLFKFDGIVWEALQDELDGYRSCLDYIVYGDKKKLIQQNKLANVIVEEYNVDNFEGYVLKDVKTNHVWLQIGTQYIDKYYPEAIFRHYPYLVE